MLKLPFKRRSSNISEGFSRLSGLNRKLIRTMHYGKRLPSFSSHWTAREIGKRKTSVGRAHTSTKTSKYFDYVDFFCKDELEPLLRHKVFICYCLDTWMLVSLIFKLDQLYPEVFNFLCRCFVLCVCVWRATSFTSSAQLVKKRKYYIFSDGFI